MTKRVNKKTPVFHANVKNRSRVYFINFCAPKKIRNTTNKINTVIITALFFFSQKGLVLLLHNQSFLSCLLGWLLKLIVRPQKDIKRIQLLLDSFYFFPVCFRSIIITTPKRMKRIPTGLSIKSITFLLWEKTILEMINFYKSYVKKVNFQHSTIIWRFCDKGGGCWNEFSMTSGCSVIPTGSSWKLRVHGIQLLLAISPRSGAE